MTDMILTGAFWFISAIGAGLAAGYFLHAAALRDVRRELEDDIAKFKRALGYGEPPKDESV